MGGLGDERRVNKVYYKGGMARVLFEFKKFWVIHIFVTGITPKVI